MKKPKAKAKIHLTEEEAQIEKYHRLCEASYAARERYEKVLNDEMAKLNSEPLTTGGLFTAVAFLTVAANDIILQVNDLLLDNKRSLGEMRVDEFSAEYLYPTLTQLLGAYYQQKSPETTFWKAWQEKADSEQVREENRPRKKAGG